ncbi:hypothetical protein [Streptacidiphilus neutrinimicus]|uniref:hypothetical protein n=1 Tax=Streptacidiphilus neutrinimicus TaxID=105420 RepID=UPI0005A6E284|nr:hypothetical protein [Streptacidiphilus neutrinimicus]
MAKTGTDGAEALKVHAEQAASAARAAAVSGVVAARSGSRKGSETVQDAAEQAESVADPLRETACQVAGQVRGTAGTLTGRAARHHDDGRPWPVRALVGSACALGMGALVWRLACTAKGGAAEVKPVVDVPLA